MVPFASTRRRAFVAAAVSVSLPSQRTRAFARPKSSSFAPDFGAYVAGFQIADETMPVRGLGKCAAISTPVIQYLRERAPAGPFFAISFARSPPTGYASLHSANPETSRLTTVPLFDLLHPPHISMQVSRTVHPPHTTPRPLRMIQAGEAFAPARSGWRNVDYRKGRGKDLTAPDGTRASVPRTVHLAHPARAERPRRSNTAPRFVL